MVTTETKQIKLVFISGMSDQGIPVRKTRTYKKVNAANATPETVQAFGQAVAALSNWALDKTILSIDQEILDVNLN